MGAGKLEGVNKPELSWPTSGSKLNAGVGALASSEGGVMKQLLAPTMHKQA